MLFGYTGPLGRQTEQFDPVRHFDMGRCTVAIDTQATNSAMKNFPASLGDSIRELLSAVPFSHPLWHIDPPLG